MNDYRPLTTEEIEQLQQNGCWAEDWTSVSLECALLDADLAQ